MSHDQDQVTVSGAIYRPVHGERLVRIYPIQENELRIISAHNNFVAFWCSIGSAALAMLASCIWDLCGKESASAQEIAFIIFVILGAIFSFGAAWVSRTNRKSELDRILDETKPHNTTSLKF